MKTNQPHATWVEVDLDALQNNVRIIRETTQTPIMAVVKANGYGHGFIPVTKAAVKAGVKWFGVARPPMAVKMRAEGILCKILVLGYIPPARIEEMIQLDVSLTIWTQNHLKLVQEAAKRTTKSAKVHLLADTGMGRLGCMPEETLSLARAVAAVDNVYLEGLFSHRPGIAIFGLPPSPDIQLPAGIKPVLSWKSVLGSIKDLPPHHGVSYGHQYITAKKERIGVIPVGYADGYRLVPGNSVLVNGKKAPVIGRVSMDQCMIQLEGIPNPQIGDEVVLIGKQGEDEITVDQVALTWNTINYEVTCGISSRVPRIFPS